MSKKRETYEVRDLSEYEVRGADADKARTALYAYVGLAQLYQFYPHKWMELNTKTVPVPYVKKEELSSHEYRLTYKQWKQVLAAYFKHLIRYMLKGYEYEIPHGMGKFSIRKDRRPIRVKKEDGGYGKKYNHATEGYSVFLMWQKRHKNVKFPFKTMYHVRMIHTIYSGIMRAITMDRSILYRLKTKKER